MLISSLIQGLQLNQLFLYPSSEGYRNHFCLPRNFTPHKPYLHEEPIKPIQFKTIRNTSNSKLLKSIQLRLYDAQNPSKIQKELSDLSPFAKADSSSLHCGKCCESMKKYEI